MKVPIIENRQEVVEFLRHCAWQERAVGHIGRTSKAVKAEHEHAAKALETVAHLLENTA